MIRPLRIRHRRIFTALGLMLPIAFGLGIAARKPVPVATNLPAEFNLGASPYAASDWEETDIFTHAPVHVLTLRRPIRGGRPTIALTAGPDFVKPDLLVYWLAGKSKAADRLPDEAVLLGAFGSPALSLPDEATRMDGAIFLYSLADGEVVAVSRPVRFKDPKN